MTRAATGVAFFLAFLAAHPTPARADEGLSDKQKIEALIKHVEGLSDAVFVRNGKAYDARTAAKFMRRKWESEQASVRTPGDFIKKVASVSSTTGKEYTIRFKDGREVSSGEYLKEQLKKLEK